MGPRFQHGQHICCAYSSEDEQLASAAEFIAEGMRDHELCVYVGRLDTARPRLRRMLGELGVNGENAVGCGALLELSSDTVYLAGGAFDPERMFHGLDAILLRAAREGFRGVRACGDMTWLEPQPPGAEHLLAYEARLTGFLRTRPALCLCQYDRRRLPADLLDHALATHTSVISKGFHRQNPFYEEDAPGRTPGTEADVRRKLGEIFPAHTYHGRGYLRGRGEGYRRGTITLKQVRGALRMAQANGVSEAELQEALRPAGLRWDVERDEIIDLAAGCT